MVYRPNPTLREQSKEIISARSWAVGLITTVLGVGLFLSEVDRIRHMTPSAMSYAYLVLLAVTGCLIFLWIWATQKELDMLFRWLDPQHYEPPSSM